jgi:hypothetical protein
MDVTFLTVNNKAGSPQGQKSRPSFKAIYLEAPRDPG